VKGWQVSPAELEGIVLQHPQVLDAAVVGVVHRNSDGLEETLPRAFVVRKPASTRKPAEASEYATPPQTPDLPAMQLLTESEIQAWVASRVISYKKLAGGVKFVDNIPRSATGKILRQSLGDSKSSTNSSIPPMSASTHLMKEFPASPKSC
jgi:4-coumarate--CoA ligase